MSRGRRITAASLAILATLALAWAMPPDGVVHAGHWRLWGRLHPLVVHFPIVLLLLVPLLEWAGRNRPALRDAAGFLLGLAMPASIGAVAAGLALARGDGHEGGIFVAHYRGGILLALGTVLAWALRGQSRAGYVTLLTTTLGLLAWTAHNGGSLTHGSTYLTEALPPAVRRALHLPEPVVPETYAPDTVLAVAVQPVLERHCLGCHGPERQKGDYRLDNFAALLAGGKSGHPAIVPAEPEQGEMLRRLLLPVDDEKVMPPRRKPRPRADEVALLAWWIRQGAPRDLKVADVKRAPAEVTRLLVGATPAADPNAEPPYVAKVADYAAHQPEMARLQRELGIELAPVSRRAGDGLILRTRATAATFGDAELARLAPIAPFIVEVELAHTQVTDAGLASLAAFTALERVHLEHTRVTGATLDRLAKLPRLDYLNLCFTSVDDQSMGALSSLAGLRRLYLFGSKVTPDGLQQLRAKLPRCETGPIAPPAEDASAQKS